MLRKILMILVVSLFLVGASKSSWAMNCHGSSKNKSHQQIAQADIKAGEETSTTVQTEKKAEEVGNKFCPVTGEKIEEKTKATYEYQGKIYNFCCPMCVDEFKKDPEKYIKKIEEEKQEEAAAKASDTAETAETEMAEHHHEHGK